MMKQRNGSSGKSLRNRRNALGTSLLRAADDVGMLVALSQPHFSHYDWQAADADEKNGYARHAEFYVRAAQNHPSVVAYSMSHNATGYDDDMNPDLIDGIRDPRDSSWSQNNAKLALRAEAIDSVSRRRSASVIGSKFFARSTFLSMNSSWGIPQLARLTGRDRE